MLLCEAKNNGSTGTRRSGSYMSLHSSLKPITQPVLFFPLKPIFSSFHSLHSPLFHPSLPLHRRPRWPRMDSSTSHHHSNQSKTKLIVIMGATGTGKSRLSIDLSSHFPHSQIINSDKMQLYKGLDITTNKIPLHERKGVPHFLLGDFDSIDADVTASEFRSAAGLTIANIDSSGNLPILVGGSNSFIHALLVETFNPEVDVFSGSGSVSHVLRYDCCFLWVDVAWSVLCDYLCKRVDEMLDSGMFEELAQFYNPAKEDVLIGLRKAIGVPEFDGYFRKYSPRESQENGVVPKDGCDPARREAYEEAVREIKDNTCRLAKRQIGKILRLKGAGWDLRRLDATATFAALMKKKKSSSADLGWMDIWEREVMEPSVKIVKRFLEAMQRQLNCWRRVLWSTVAHIIKEGAVLELLVVVRSLIVATVIMRQRTISMLTRSSDMTSHAIKSVRSFVHYVAQNKRSSKSALTVAYVWGNISARPANFLMTIHQRDSIIVMVVGSVELEDRRISSIATIVVAAILFF